jgi:hypothetical protein
VTSLMSLETTKAFMVCPNMCLVQPSESYDSAAHGGTKVH